GIGAGGQGAAQIVQGEALLLPVGRGAGRWGLAVLALAVRAIHPGGDLGEFFSFRIIVRGGRGQRELQQCELPRQLRRHFELVKAASLKRKLRDHGSKFFLGLGGEDLGVVGDEVLLNPTGAAGAYAQILQLVLSFFHENLSLGDRGCSLRASCIRGRGWPESLVDDLGNRGPCGCRRLGRERWGQERRVGLRQGTAREKKET